MEKLIESKYQEAFENKIPIAKEWLYDFMIFFKYHECSEQQLETLLNKLLSKENLKKMQKGDFLGDNISKKNEKAFFQYLERINDRLTPEYINQGIDYALTNINENNNLIDSFIKYIVATNFQDLNIKSTISNMEEIGDEGKMNCCLGDFLLCRVETTLWDEQTIAFDNLFTRKNLTGTKVGSVLFKEMMKEVNENFPGKDLFAGTVMQTNTDGLRFYERMGGEFFNPDKPDEIISNREIDNTNKENICVIYRQDKLKELSEIPTEPPYIEISQRETQEKANNFAEKIKALFNQIKQLFQKEQPKALPEATKIVEKSPEQKEVDRQKLINEIRGTSKGQTYTYDNTRDNSYIHELNNSKDEIGR